LAHLLTDITCWHWFGLSVVLFIIEVTVATGGFLLWLGISAALVGVLVWFFPHILWYQQLLFFSAGAIASSIGWWLYLRKHPLKTTQPSLNRRGEQYIGRIVDLQEAIVNHRGKVRMGDVIWRVSGDDMPAGTKVEIVGIDGVILQVVPADESP